MLARILWGAVRLQPTRLALVVLSTAMGSGIAGALGSVSMQAGERLAAELRHFGANVVVEPARSAGPAGIEPGQAWLQEADLPRVLTIFWRHAVVGLAPSLTAPGDVVKGARRQRAVLAGLWFDHRLQRPGGGGELRAGVVPLFPYWEVQGRWPSEEPAAPPEVVLGQALAARLEARPGDAVELLAAGRSETAKVTGLLRTGGFEDEEALIPLAAAQGLVGAPGRISRALVSAVTVPLDGFGRRDPAQMTRREYEKWFCTPYVTSVAHQVQEALPGSRARPVWSMAEAEARVLGRLDLLLLFLGAASLGAAALAAGSTFTARVVGRRTEIALWRATGASAFQVGLLLGTELAVLALAGGLIGAGLASVLVGALGMAVFGSPLVPGWELVPLALAGSLVVAVAGAVWPLRQALALDPAAELKGAA